MKKTLFITLMVALIGFSANAQPKYDTLTNKTIIKLSRVGLSEATIISKIKSSVTAFNVSIDSLINLKENGVSGPVIDEMIKINESVNTSVVNVINEKDPTAMHKSGIYYFNVNDSITPVKKIEVVKVTSFKTSSGGYGGYGGSSTSAILSGLSSKQQISGQNPVFYFYFNTDEKSTADWYDNASSPNEFALVKVIPKKDQRIFKVGGGSYNAFSSNSSEGIPENLKLPFDFTKISEGIYKVTFKTPLVVGEYCFVYATATYKVFDFGITAGSEK